MNFSILSPKYFCDILAWKRNNRKERNIFALLLSELEWVDDGAFDESRGAVRCFSWTDKNSLNKRALSLWTVWFWDWKNPDWLESRSNLRMAEWFRFWQNSFHFSRLIKIFWWRFTPFVSSISWEMLGKLVKFLIHFTPKNVDAK